MTPNDPYLDFEYLEANSDQPEVPVNTNDSAISAALCAPVTVSIGNSGIVTLTQDQQAAGRIFNLMAESPGPTGPITVKFPAIAYGVFAVANKTGFPASLEINGQAMTPPTLDAGSVAVFVNDAVNIRAAGSSGSSGSGIILAIQASETLAAGDIVNVWNSSGARIRKANATDNTKPANGFVLEAVTSGNIGIFYGSGQIDSSRSGMTPGTVYYLDTTGGGINATAPSSAGNLVQALGVALSATQLAFAPNQGITL